MAAAAHLKDKKDPDNSHTKWAQHICKRFKEVYQKVRAKLHQSRLAQRKNYDLRVEPEEFKVGDLVYLHHPAVKEGRTRKLTQPWKGPLKITKRLSAENVEVGPIDATSKSSIWRTHVNRLKKCPEGSLELYPLSKESVEGQLEEDFDLIDKITADRRSPDEMFYRVLWQTEGDRTWEPEDNLPPAAIRDYLRS